MASEANKPLHEKVLYIFFKKKNPVKTLGHCAVNKKKKIILSHVSLQLFVTNSNLKEKKVSSQKCSRGRNKYNFMLFSSPFKNWFMLKDYQRKKIVSPYFFKNFFYIFATDSKSVLNFAFYDTDVELVKNLAYNANERHKKTKYFHTLYVSSQFFLVFLSSLKGSILSKKFKIVVPYYTIYILCTLCYKALVAA